MVVHSLETASISNVLARVLSVASDRSPAQENKKREFLAHVTAMAKQGLIQGSDDVIRTQLFFLHFLALLPL